MNPSWDEFEAEVEAAQAWFALIGGTCWFKDDHFTYAIQKRSHGIEVERSTVSGVWTPGWARELVWKLGIGVRTISWERVIVELHRASKEGRVVTQYGG